MHATHHQPIRAGALTLLLTVTALCLALLAVLTLSTARADLVLANKQAALARATAQANSLGQEFLAQLDASLAAGKPLPAPARQNADGSISATLDTGDGRQLYIALQPLQGSPRYRLLAWSFSSPWAPDQSLELWPGN